MAEDREVRTLAQLIRGQAAARPERVATVFEGRETRYGELDARAERVAGGLLAAGCAPQGRVAILAKNSDHYTEILFGAAKANLVLVPVNWRLAPPEVRFIVDDAGAEVLFVGPEFAALVEAIREELPSLRAIVALGADHGAWEAYESWRDRHQAPRPERPAAPSDIAVQMYTSGTTGLPKGAQLSHHGLCELVSTGTRQFEAWSAAEVSLVAMPLFHIGGTGYALLGYHMGATNVIMPEVDPGAIIAAIARHRVTKVFFVPAVILFILEHPSCSDADFSSLDLVLYGAAPMPQDLLTKALRVLGCGFAQVYGLTETSGAVTYLEPHDHDPARPELLLSCGKAMEGIEIAVVDGDDNPVAPREVGEIVCRASQNMVGYWNLPEETARALRGGWFHTGDAGYLDEAGYLYIYDRVKDMIISGGENIYPAEVENALFGHPGVADVAAIGVPDERWGEAVKAIVVARPGAEPTAEELIAFAKTRIADFKAPSSVDFVAELPRNPSGKILKRELREPYWRGRQRKVN